MCLKNTIWTGKVTPKYDQFLGRFIKFSIMVPLFFFLFSRCRRPPTWRLSAVVVFVTAGDDMLKFARQFSTCHLLYTLHLPHLFRFWNERTAMRRRIIFIINIALERVAIGMGWGVYKAGEGGPGISHEFMTFWFAWNLLLARMRPPQSVLVGPP